MGRRYGHVCWGSGFVLCPASQVGVVPPAILSMRDGKAGTSAEFLHSYRTPLLFSCKYHSQNMSLGLETLVPPPFFSTMFVHQFESTHTLRRVASAWRWKVRPPFLEVMRVTKIHGRPQRTIQHTFATATWHTNTTTTHHKHHVHTETHTHITLTHTPHTTHTS